MITVAPPPARSGAFLRCLRAAAAVSLAPVRLAGIVTRLAPGAATGYELDHITRDRRNDSKHSTDAPMFLMVRLQTFTNGVPNGAPPSPPTLSSQGQKSNTPSKGSDTSTPRAGLPIATGGAGVAAVVLADYICGLVSAAGAGAGA